MKAQEPVAIQPANVAPLLADHPALDFLNTLVRVRDEDVDFLSDDAAVMAWLLRTGFTDEDAREELAGELSSRPGVLKDITVGLRENSRQLIALHKTGKWGDPAIINRFLERGGSYRQLAWGKETSPATYSYRRLKTLEDLLVPVAEAVADLLSHGDVELVRKCENPECRMWFYDRTKSHKRRWCSMALCGNRMKVAAFRARERG